MHMQYQKTKPQLAARYLACVYSRLLQVRSSCIYPKLVIIMVFTSEED